MSSCIQQVHCTALEYWKSWFMSVINSNSQTNTLYRPITLHLSLFTKIQWLKNLKKTLGKKASLMQKRWPSEMYFQACALSTWLLLSIFDLNYCKWTFEAPLPFQTWVCSRCNPSSSRQTLLLPAPSAGRSATPALPVRHTTHICISMSHDLKQRKLHNCHLS